MNHPIDPALRLQPGQQDLTPAQEAEAQRYTAERIAAQLSIEPVDEPEAERLLRQAYAVAQLPPPTRIQWVDGPLRLMRLVATRAPHNIEERIWGHIRDSVWDTVFDSVIDSVEEGVWESVEGSVRNHMIGGVRRMVGESVQACLEEHLRVRMGSMAEGRWAHLQASIQDSVWAYTWASGFAFYRFFDEYWVPNDLHALAHFNEMVSGYWLGSEAAIIVRRPRLLTRDQQGHLHSAMGKCIEYHDGWGFYAWHGVRAPEKVILAPEQLTRDDFLDASNVEVRRVIQERMQERMGERFVWELGGVMLDVGERGTLYEVALPQDDPERVAHYVQVEDASTHRQYCLRVPPTVQTADEAVAWTFQLTGGEYRPAQET